MKKYSDILEWAATHSIILSGKILKCYKGREKSRRTRRDRLDSLTIRITWGWGKEQNYMVKISGKKKTKFVLIFKATPSYLLKVDVDSAHLKQDCSA